MSQPAEMSISPEAEAAFGRVREELARNKLVSKARLASLKLKGARRERFARFEIEARAVTREVGWAEVPLKVEPAAPPVKPELWGTSWPPTRADLVKDETLDLRKSYELLTCESCEGEGGQDCPDCKGEGFINPPDNPYKHADCTRCGTKGRLSCTKCAGAGRLLKYPQVQQRVRSVRQQHSFPPDASAFPEGKPSGEVELSQHAGFASAAQASAAISTRAAGLAASPWLEQVAESLFTACQVKAEQGDTLLGWVELKGRWFDGWLLECETGGKPVTYFAPDGGVVIGPRLHDPRKLGAIFGGAAALLLLVVGVVAISRSCEEEDPLRATQIELDEDETHALDQRRDVLEAKRRAAKEESKRRMAERRRQLFQEQVATARASAEAPGGGARALEQYRQAESMGIIVGEDAKIFARLLKAEGERAARRGDSAAAAEALERAQTLDPSLEGVEELLATHREQLDAKQQAAAERAAAKDRNAIMREVSALQREIGKLLKQSQRKMRPLRAKEDPAATEACAVYERLQAKPVAAMKQRVGELPFALREVLQPAADDTAICLTCGAEADEACARTRDALRAAKPAIRAYKLGKETP